MEIPCENCGILIPLNQIFEHYQDHFNNGNFSCKFCSMKYTKSANLSKHLMIYHTIQTPYQCRLCPKQFGNICDLNHHMLAVHRFTKTGITLSKTSKKDLSTPTDSIAIKTEIDMSASQSAALSKLVNKKDGVVTEKLTASKTSNCKLAKTTTTKRKSVTPRDSCRVNVNKDKSKIVNIKSQSLTITPVSTSTTSKICQSVISNTTHTSEATNNRSSTHISTNNLKQNFTSRSSSTTSHFITSTQKKTNVKSVRKSSPSVTTPDKDGYSLNNIGIKLPPGLQITSVSHNNQNTSSVTNRPDVFEALTANPNLEVVPVKSGQKSKPLCQDNHSYDKVSLTISEGNESKRELSVSLVPKKLAVSKLQKTLVKDNNMVSVNKIPSLPKQNSVKISLSVMNIDKNSPVSSNLIKKTVNVPVSKPNISPILRSISNSETSKSKSLSNIQRNISDSAQSHIDFKQCKGISNNSNSKSLTNAQRKISDTFQSNSHFKQSGSISNDNCIERKSLTNTKAQSSFDFKKTKIISNTNSSENKSLSESKKTVVKSHFDFKTSKSISNTNNSENKSLTESKKTTVPSHFHFKTSKSISNVNNSESKSQSNVTQNMSVKAQSHFDFKNSNAGSAQELRVSSIGCPGYTVYKVQVSPSSKKQICKDITSRAAISDLTLHTPTISCVLSNIQSKTNGSAKNSYSKKSQIKSLKMSPESVEISNNTTSNFTSEAPSVPRFLPDLQSKVDSIMNKNNQLQKNQINRNSEKVRSNLNSNTPISTFSLDLQCKANCDINKKSYSEPEDQTKACVIERTNSISNNCSQNKLSFSGNQNDQRITDALAEQKNVEKPKSTLGKKDINLDQNDCKKKRAIHRSKNILPKKEKAVKDQNDCKKKRVINRSKNILPKKEEAVKYNLKNSNISFDNKNTASDNLLTSGTAVCATQNLVFQSKKINTPTKLVENNKSSSLAQLINKLSQSLQEKKNAQCSQLDITHSLTIPSTGIIVQTENESRSDRKFCEKSKLSRRKIKRPTSPKTIQCSALAISDSDAIPPADKLVPRDNELPSKEKFWKRKKMSCREWIKKYTFKTDLECIKKFLRDQKLPMPHCEQRAGRVNAKDICRYLPIIVIVERIPYEMLKEDYILHSKRANANLIYDTSMQDAACAIDSLSAPVCCNKAFIEPSSLPMSATKSKNNISSNLHDSNLFCAAPKSNLKKHVAKADSKQLSPNMLIGGIRLGDLDIDISKISKITYREEKNIVDNLKKTTKRTRKNQDNFSENIEHLSKRFRGSKCRSTNIIVSEDKAILPSKKPRGRPPKRVNEENAILPPKKPRGRPPKRVNEEKKVISNEKTSDVSNYCESKHITNVNKQINDGLQLHKNIVTSTKRGKKSINTEEKVELITERLRRRPPKSTITKKIITKNEETYQVDDYCESENIKIINSLQQDKQIVKSGAKGKKITNTEENVNFTTKRPRGRPPKSTSKRNTIIKNEETYENNNYCESESIKHMSNANRQINDRIQLDKQIGKSAAGEKKIISNEEAFEITNKRSQKRQPKSTILRKNSTSNEENVESSKKISRKPRKTAIIEKNSTSNEENIEHFNKRSQSRRSRSAFPEKNSISDEYNVEFSTKNVKRRSSTVAASVKRTISNEETCEVNNYCMKQSLSHMSNISQQINDTTKSEIVKNENMMFKGNKEYERNISKREMSIKNHNVEMILTDSAFILSNEKPNQKRKSYPMKQSSSPVKRQKNMVEDPCTTDDFESFEIPKPITVPKRTFSTDSRTMADNPIVYKPYENTIVSKYEVGNSLLKKIQRSFKMTTPRKSISCSSISSQVSGQTSTPCKTVIASTKKSGKSTETPNRPTNEKDLYLIPQNSQQLCITPNSTTRFEKTYDNFSHRYTSTPYGSSQGKVLHFSTPAATLSSDTSQLIDLQVTTDDTYTIKCPCGKNCFEFEGCNSHCLNFL